MPEAEDALLDLLRAIEQSSRYRQVSPDLVRSIGRAELAAHPRLKEAVKATKNRLHQVYGAFYETEPRYAEWLRLLREAAESGDPAVLRTACATVMRYHTSTRERLSSLPAFYATILAGLPPIRSVLDLACGLNPLAFPWMGLPDRVTYTAYDIDAGMIGFLNEAFPLLGVAGSARVRNLVSDPPADPVDLALTLKALPTLESLDRTAPARLLRTARARHLLVSFPARTLGGRNKGMAESYAARFEALAATEGYAIQSFAFPTEIAFLAVRE